jgi:hypothetical protein
MPETVFIFDIDSTIANTDKRARNLIRVCSVCLSSRLEGEVNDPSGYCVTCKQRTPGKVPQSAWDKFLDPVAMAEDKHYDKAVEFIQQLRRRGYELHFITGRNESGREVTETWLSEHVGWNAAGTEKLIMRRASMSGVPASRCKEALFLDSFRDRISETCFFFFEDDQHVFNMYSKYGIVIKCPEAWEQGIILPEGTNKPEALLNR